ncbi:MAG: VWA domain-containing protein [Flavobacteriales bacterium]
MGSRLVIAMFLFIVAQKGYCGINPLVWTVNENQTILAGVFNEQAGKRKVNSSDFTHFVRFYSLEKNCLSREIPIRLQRKEKIESFTIDARGRYAMLRTNFFNYIYQVANSKQIYACPASYVCALPQSNSFAAFHNGSHLRLVNLQNGEVAGTYRSLVKGQIQKIVFTHKGKWVIYNDNSGQVYIHKMFSRNPKKIKGHTWTLNQNGVLYALYTDSRKMHVVHYDVYNEKMIEQYDIKETELSSLKGENLTSALAPGGRYILFQATDNPDTLIYKVYDMVKKSLVDLTIHALRSDKSAAADWYRDSLLILHTNKYALLFNPENPFYVVNADYSITKKTDLAGKTSEIFSPKKTNHTVDNVYSYISYGSEKTAATHLRPAFLGEKSQCVVQQSLFVDYHEKSGIFLFNYRDSLAWLSNADIELADLYSPVKPTLFGDCLPSGDPPTTQMRRPPEEAFVFSNNSQKTTVDGLSRVPVKMYYQSAWGTDTTVNIEFQVFDTYGNFYSGLTDSAFKRIWCDIKLYDKAGNPVSATTARMNEFSQWAGEPADIGIVMDFSGSMGQDNANRIHFGTEKLIEQLDPRDRAFIVKYDGRVDIFSELTNNKEVLATALNKKGYPSFAGSTSIVDALYYSNEKLRKAAGNRKRIIFLITDGMENSSATSVRELMKELERSGTKVYCIGYGLNISEGFLKGISYRSKGGFYKVFNAEELVKIYKDVYFKSRNYYRLDINVNRDVVRYINVKACFPAENDSMLIRYADERKLLTRKNEIYTPKPFDELQKDTTLSAQVMKRYFPSKKTHYRPPSMTYTKPGEVTDILAREVEPGKKNVPTTNNAEIQADETNEEIIVSEARNDFTTLKLPILLFKYDTDEIITENVDKELEALLAYLKKYDETALSVYAHTDSRGDLTYNQKLSLRRATRVVNLLIEKGVSADRLSAHAMGEGTPVADNQTEEGMQQNRRAIFELEE